MRKLKCILTLLLTSEALCQQGNRRLKREPIFKGSVKNIDRIPYFASIVQYDRNFQQWFPVCGASIISNKLILTAAYCIREAINDLNIRTGFHNYFSPEYGDYLHEIVNVLPHPNYVYGDIVNYNDIGLINLTKPVDFINNLQMPISLPSEAFDVRTGLRLTILGFGYQTTEFNGKKTVLLVNLLSDTVELMKRKDCGPAVAKSQLVGIISTGGMKMDKCPGLYIDVRKFVD